MNQFRLDEILEELNMSKQQLADNIGLSRTNMYNYLSNDNSTINVLNKIAKEVRLPVSELFKKQEELITGYVEFNNFIYKICSKDDFEVLIEEFKKHFAKSKNIK